MYAWFGCAGKQRAKQSPNTWASVTKAQCRTIPFHPGGAAEKMVRDSIVLGLKCDKPNQKISPKIGNCVGKKPGKFECMRLFPWQFRLPVSELHHGPPRRKSLPMAVATRNEKWRHLHLRLHLPNKDPLSKFSNSCPKSNNETESSRTLKNSDLQYSSMNKIQSSLW